MDEAPPARTPTPLPVRIDDLDLNQVVISYDRDSDTLMLHLGGRGQPGISTVVDDDRYVRMDRERKRVLGFQIEGFLSRVVREHPELLDALDVADLRGISLEEVARLRREIAPDRRKRAAVGDVIDQFPRFTGVSGAGS